MRFPCHGGEKVNKYGSRYTYYHCTKRRLDVRCSQGHVSNHTLETQLEAVLSSFAVDDRTLKLLHDQFQRFDEVHQQALTTREQVLGRGVASLDRQAANLTNLRVRDALSDQEYEAEKKRIADERISLTASLQALQTQKEWFELIITLFEASKQMLFWLQEGDDAQKREIVSAVGSNLRLMDGKVLYDNVFPSFAGLEMGQCSSLLSVLEEVRTKLSANDPKLTRAIALFRKLLREEHPITTNDRRTVV